MYANREIFAQSPLALVAAEIRFTDAARLRQQQTKDEVTIALEGRFPFAEPLHQTDFNLTSGASPQIQQRAGVVLKNTKSTETLTIMSESVTYETTSYVSFDKLLESVVAACEALAASKVKPALQRVGLRYIDEVRVPNKITDVRQWSRWIDHHLVDHLAVGPEGQTATMAQSVSTFDLGEGRGLNFRSAALNQGPIVVPQHLKREVQESGPFFVLDFDGFQDFTQGQLVPLNPGIVRETLSAVHVPCGTAFQRSITDEARQLFRGAQS
ncbi:TIGR04255 family protein [Amycolatopsis sp. lyj-346]|uniref:TIGR04255 family protein n=1 Tax=Amycolatopsis sp. lyj-346 TaxID=2789289 RepID=UPI00397DC682